MIKVNKSTTPKPHNIIFGMCNIIDGMVRVASLGYLCSTFALAYSRRLALNNINRQS